MKLQLLRRHRPGQVLGLTLILALVLAGCLARLVRASGRASVTLMAAPQVIFADGKSTTVITATVRDGDGNLAADGSPVRFETSQGTLDKDTIPTASGVARVTLTSASVAGTATVKATAFAGAGGASLGDVKVEFTADRDEIYTSGEATWVRVDCPVDLLYSADSKIVDAHGHQGRQSAHLRYRAFDLAADDLQVDLQTLWVLARNATLRRGSHTLRAVQLRFNLRSGDGTAVVTTAKVAAQSVSVSGYELATAPMDSSTVSLDTNPYRFADLSDSRVVVTARALDAQPGDQVRFRHAAIYSEGKKIVSLPYHVMPMTTDQLFGQQLIGVGSQGLFLNIPYYYNVTAHSLGTLYLRNSAVAGATLTNPVSTGSSFGSYGTRPGLALDLEQTYDTGRNGSGMLTFSGLTRGDWGAHWNHTQRIDSATSGYFYIDSPTHRSLYASSNLTRQFNGFSMNVTANGSRDPGFDGYSSSSATLNTYLQTAPRALGGSGVNMTTSLSFQTGQLVQTAPDTGRVVTPLSTEGLDFRFFTAPLRPDRRTSITDSLSVGQSWGQGRSAMTLLGTLSLGRVMPNNGHLSLDYTYRYDPLLSQVSSQTTANNPLGTLFYTDTEQRLSLNYSMAPLRRLSFALSAGYGLPLHDSSIFGSLNYRVSNDWGLGIASIVERYGFDSYRDTSFSISRRFFGRDLIFYYSTQTKKLRFDLAASSF